MQDRFSPLFYRICICGCLLGATATLYFIGGLMGYLKVPLLNVTVAGVSLLAALYFIYVFFGSMVGEGKAGFLIWLLILMVLFVEVVLGLVPPTARDELSHHLAIPRLYVKAGRILEVPYAPYSYYPMLLDMLYTPWVQWGWDSIPKHIHGLFGFLTALLLYAYLSRRLSPIYGLLGFFLFVFTPAVLRLSNWAYVDLGVAFYSTASLLCLLRYAEAANDKRWLVLSGLLAGFAIAAKPNGLLVFFLLFFLLVIFIDSLGPWNRKASVGGIALFLIMVLIPVSPWFLKNLIWTGNPFFPLLERFFGSGAGLSVGGGSELGILSKRQLLYGESSWEIAALPLRLFFSGQDDNPRYFDGVLNPILILFLPWAFKGKWLGEKKVLFGFALFYFLYAFFLTELRVRYILPVIPPLVLLLVYGIHNVYLRIARPFYLFVLLLFLLVLNGVYLWKYFHAVSPMDYLSGRESREAYLSRMLPEYPAIRFINENLPGSARVYFLLVGRRVYYSDRDYFHDTGENPGIFLQMVQLAQNEEEVKVWLLEKGITHLLIRRDLFLRFLGENLTSAQKDTWNRFLGRNLTRLFEQRGYGVFEIQREG